MPKLTLPLIYRSPVQVVYEELLEVSLASEVRKHTSFLQAEAAAATGLGLGPHSLNHPGIPLSRCLDKFTEDEVGATTTHPIPPLSPVTDHLSPATYHPYHLLIVAHYL